MYEYIKGKVADIYEDKVIIECNGIGYAVFISLNSLANLSKGDERTELYLHEVIREDEMSFYGFIDKKEREIFRNLLSISGVGPKVSLGILSKFNVADLIRYISLGDEKALSSAPGIGKKTANRIILELKDKFEKLSISNGSSIMNNEESFIENGVRDDTISALMSLGYNYDESSQLVDKVYQPEMKLEDLLKKALSTSIKK